MNLRFYIIAYRECWNFVVENLDEKELDYIYCYAVNEKYKKDIGDKFKHVIYECDLPFYNPVFQNLQYYESSLLAHCGSNTILTKDLTHICSLHYDTTFSKNGVNNTIKELEKNPQQIMYVSSFITDKISLYLTHDQLYLICEYMSKKIGTFVNADIAWNIGWPASYMVVAPVEIFTKFGKFVWDNHEDLEDMMRNNRWGINDNGRHRPCGLLERMFGFYVMSAGLPVTKTYEVKHTALPTGLKHDAWEEDFKTFKI